MTPEDRGHSLERYQMPQMVLPYNQVPGTPGDLKSAAATSLGKWAVPEFIGRWKLLGLGHIYAAAGGAQTTAGAWKLQKAGADVESSAGVPFTLASTASHTEADSDETSLNATTTALSLSQAPSYPFAAAGQLLEALVSTQGVGAGDQTVYVYLVVAFKVNPAIAT